MPSYDVITDFWKWYERRRAPEHGVIADLALDKCEETFRKCEWESFGYWNAIYRRERPKMPHSAVTARPQRT
jgi:hypothetical protein